MKVRAAWWGTVILSVFVGSREMKAGDVSYEWKTIFVSEPVPDKVAGQGSKHLSLAGLAVDDAGNIYLAEGRRNTIAKISPAGARTLVAGQDWIAGSADGVGAAAQFDYPQSIVLDPFGDLLVSDQNNNVIRKITPQGRVFTFAGSANARGSKDGQGAQASFDHPGALAMDRKGNLYVGDVKNESIRKVTPTGVVTTFVANRPAGTADQVQANTRKLFNLPSGVAVDDNGDVVFAAYQHHLILAASPTGILSVLGGVNENGDPVDGPVGVARFGNTMGMAADDKGNLFVVESNTVRKMTREGVVTTIGGIAPVRGKVPDPQKDGMGINARIPFARGLAISSSGVLYVTCLDTIVRGTPVR
jgi:sugar lactone lactonase YvrE